jgi:hypothetical protein
MRVALAGWSLVLVLVMACGASAAPLVEKYLLEGKLTEGAAVLTKQLTANPKDDEARFGLGMIQFLQAYEHLGASLYRYGLRTERAFVGPDPAIRELLPQNPNPEKIDYAAARQIVQTFVDDVNRAEATIALVQGEQVKLPLHVGLIKLDPFGRGTPVSAAALLRRFGGQMAGPGVPLPEVAEVQEFVIAFDRGDASWLRGYCHFLAAWGEVLLAVDGQDLFECSFHWVFEKVETPHKFLLEEREPIDNQNIFSWDRKRVSDWIAAIHLLLRLPMKEPERMKVAHGHLVSMAAMSREMWKHYQAETDDDHEWIPNPKQTGVLQTPVSQEMIATWLATVEEAELILAGKRLLPFWRGSDPQLGLNLKRVFYEPRTLDVLLWFQGTAATPYLERGEITKFADAEMLRRLNRQFGGMGFVGFAFWFN